MPQKVVSFGAAQFNYGNFFKRSNRFLQKNRKSFSRRRRRRRWPGEKRPDSSPAFAGPCFGCHLSLVTCLPFWLHPAVTVKPPTSAPASSRVRLNVFYSGRVQGVGFRYTAKSVAAGFEITGTVRNLPDGRVELVAEGARAELEAFCAAIRAEGLSGFIRDEQVSWAAAQNEFRGFEIVR